ncbi:MAG: sugar ABC transporter ATP-binding protein [Mesorhizobium sp.]|uniref:sugar ABC transporter ATP-binding protein n=1 Tax=Mesorhizobium TaxID=68287 RepID=UPI0003CF20ED|nr:MULTISPECIES: sugar ABC transporter ATP-binding protein [Mesorhizobium]ESY65579.1 lipase [Mesorhizobium sp. LNHC232B00]TJV37557.1 MAG: sugar ABC transporter ATP-binding protein [Mesorhizobium sp.]WJI35842.1 sugar ABC transporter ATP-binding protein [Mesorhizobium opportunistum]
MSFAVSTEESRAVVLSLRNISVTFGGVRALQDVSFEVLPGEVQCIAGENGSGKSTLIKVVTGVYQPLAGAQIAFAGKAVDVMSPAAARAAGVEVIWQDLALFPEMTVAENIGIRSVLGALPRIVNHGAMRDTARRLLGRLGADLDVDAPLRTFAIAQRQIVAIARALAGDAKVIFMDEPTSSLTQSETDRLLDTVRTLAADGVSIVFVSHRLAEVLEISRRVTVLRDGKLVGVYPTEGMTQSRLTELMTGKTFDQGVRMKDHSASPVVLAVEGLTRAGDYADVSLTIRRGETVGLTGLLGAGRTELALSIFGMLPPDRGRVLLNGKVLSLRSNRDAIRAGIGYLSEDRLALGLIQQQSIADNLVISVLDKVLDRGFISFTKKEKLVTRWIDELAIKIDRPTDPISTLSGGNQQRVAIAKWLAVGLKLIILDAPTVGVDVGARAGIFEIVARLAEAGLAILLISDEVPEVYFNADRVLHMVAGRIVTEYDPRAVSLSDLEAAVYA